jgi:LPS export ABC transporter protein LptC
MFNYILSILITFFFSCAKNNIESLPSRVDFPDQESWGVKILLTKEGRLRADISSGHLEKYNEKEFIILNESVEVKFFDKMDRVSSRIISKSAEVDQISNDMQAKGNVIAESDSGIILYSETLNYNSREERLYTKDSIMVTTLEADTLYGIGFESDSDLRNWHILEPSGVTNKGFK